jgi:hypothetical protein
MTTSFVSPVPLPILTVPPERWTAETLADALRARGVSPLRTVVFPKSRRVAYHYSLGALKLSPCFRTAPDSVIDDLAVVLTAPSRRGRVEPFHIVAAKSYVMEFVTAMVMSLPPKPTRCDGSPAQRQSLAASYATLNAKHFGGCLPADMPLRWSSRLVRTVGIFAAVGGGQDRRAGGIVMSLALALPGNPAVYRDTLLHEMAHAEAWLIDGDGGHGGAWQRVARRVGARVVKCGRTRLPERPVAGVSVRDVPPVLDT